MRQRNAILAAVASLVLSLSAAAVLALAPAALAARGLTIGLGSDYGIGVGAFTGARYFADASREGVQVIRVNVTWYQVAPRRRPRGFDAGDPSSPGYDWGPVDSELRALAARGIRPVVDIWGAPRWAEQGKLGRFARAGTWMPSARDLAQFARAAALRYDGRYPDPLHPGAFLPRVSNWQVWNEPNLSYYLNPQWRHTRHGWRQVAAGTFRALANAFYDAVKGVSRSDRVILGGTAPYGDPPGGPRTQPVAFYRYLFCLTVRLRPLRCRDPVHADAIDHHPYGIGGPLQHALNPDDAAIPDLYKIVRVLHAAERHRHILPRGPKSVWATEFSWDSRPPDPHGVPIQRQARWLEQALYVLWRQGASLILWLQLVDAPPIPSYAASYQAGLYYLDGRAKPAATAYRFPFLSSRAGRGRIVLWGRSPASGTLVVQVRRNHRWATLRRLHIRAGSVFESRVALRGAATLRAEVGRQRSLTWRQPR